MRKAKSSVDSASTWGHYQSAFCTIKRFKPFRPTYAAPATEAPETKLESLGSQYTFLHMPSDLSRATDSKQQLNKPLLRIGCDGGFCLLTGLFSKAFNMDFWSLQGSWQEFLANKLERCTAGQSMAKTYLTFHVVNVVVSRSLELLTKKVLMFRSSNTCEEQAAS